MKLNFVDSTTYQFSTSYPLCIFHAIQCKAPPKLAIFWQFMLDILIPAKALDTKSLAISSLAPPKLGMMICEPICKKFIYAQSYS